MWAVSGEPNGMTNDCSTYIEALNVTLDFVKHHMLRRISIFHIEQQNMAFWYEQWKQWVSKGHITRFRIFFSPNINAQNSFHYSCYFFAMLYKSAAEHNEKNEKNDFHDARITWPSGFSLYAFQPSRSYYPSLWIINRNGNYGEWPLAPALTHATHEYYYKNIVCRCSWSFPINFPGDDRLPRLRRRLWSRRFLCIFRTWTLRMISDIWLGSRSADVFGQCIVHEFHEQFAYIILHPSYALQPPTDVCKQMLRKIFTNSTNKKVRAAGINQRAFVLQQTTANQTSANINCDPFGN